LTRLHDALQANAKKAHANIATHFSFLRQRLKEREDKLQVGCFWQRGVRDAAVTQGLFSTEYDLMYEMRVKVFEWSGFRRLFTFLRIYQFKQIIGSCTFVHVCVCVR
jgi:hypothetical protein